jgi:16S rRNA (cytosine967-C5)-methyltransferase
VGLTPGVRSRAAALDLLTAVLVDRRALEECFDDCVNPHGLEPRDRGFAHVLAATVLRRLGQIDDVLRRCLDKPLKPSAARVQNMLRLGAAQLLFLATPPHAAVGETVALATGNAAAFRGLVNAVLRRISREGAAMLALQDAAKFNTPHWLWTAWSQAWGEAGARAIADANAAEAAVDITVRADAATWAATLNGEVLPSGSVRCRPAERVETLPGFSDGAWWVQDAAAALPARLLGDVDGKRVADLCAAPGGKTLQLSAAGAAVTAVDRSGDRLEKVRENLARIGLKATLVTADVLRWQPGELFDAVLLDAPCTATGTIRRHPDLPHLKRKEDVGALASLQRRMLAHAASLLKPGGTLVYATCSLQPEEGEQQARGVALQPLPIDAAALGVPADCITPEGWLRTLPSVWGDKGGMDGFFAARWVKA